MTKKNSLEELNELANYVHGMADGSHNEKLDLASKWLARAACHICGQGFFGCNLGADCRLDDHNRKATL